MALRTRARERNVSNSDVWLLVSAALSGLLALTAFSLQRAEHMHWIWYFSNIASLTLVVGAAALLARPHWLPTMYLVDLAAVTTVFSAVVYFTVIVPHNGFAEWSDPWSITDNATLHVTSPALALLVAWRFRTHDGRPAPVQVASWLPLPVLYVVVVLGGNQAGWIEEIPYDFLSISIFGGARFAIHVIALVAIYTLAAVPLLLLKYKKQRTL